MARAGALHAFDAGGGYGADVMLLDGASALADAWLTAKAGEPGWFLRRHRPRRRMLRPGQPRRHQHA